MRSLQPFAPKPDGELQAPPVQWNLLAWAALLGVLTGLAIVGFHALLGSINNFLFGRFVEGLLTIGRSPLHPLEVPVTLPPPPAPAALGTPLQKLLQIGLDGLGFVPPPPPPPPEPPPLPSLQVPDWLSLWPVLVVPTLGGALVGVLRRWLGDLGPGLPSLMAMADGDQPAASKVPWLRLLAA
ncbi:MAG: chloride channel protein, partial [Cyanobacteria bacterium K_DeepCast_35m_m2_023]|nr:chloride channel protein [Cyanobacteria bacterium K_DeepCast_35m_m2_023]